MNSKLILLISLVVVLTGCEPPSYPKYELDQTLRRSLFKECMASLPAGPSATKYNDWDEVVSRCDSVAYAQAQVCIADCQILPVIKD